MNAPTRQEAAVRHARYYAGVLARYGDRQIAGEDVLGELDQEWSQILAAHAAALAATEDARADRVLSDMADARVLISYRLTPQERLEWLDAARDAADRLDDNGAVFQHYRAMGVAYRELGRYELAGEVHARALTIAKAVGAEDAEAQESDYLAVCLAHLGEIAEPRSLWTRAVELMDKVGDRDGEGVTRLNFGSALWRWGETAAALEHFERASALLLEVAPHKASGALGQLAGALSTSGELERALAVSERALALARELGDRDGEARQLVGRGGVQRLAGDADGALRSFEEARAVAVAIGDPAAEAFAVQWIGIARADAADRHAPIEAAAEQLALARARRSPEAEHDALLTLGDAHRDAGALQQAADLYDQALRLAQLRLSAEPDQQVIRAHRIRAAASEAHVRLGDLYADAGHPPTAVEHFRAALELLEGDVRRRARAEALAKLGYAQSALGAFDAAQAAHEERVRLAREIGDRGVEADATGEIGNVLMVQGRFEESLPYYSAALAIDQDTGNDADAMAVLVQVGHPLRCLGRYDEAVAAFEQGGALARARGATEAEGLALLGLAQTREMTGRPRCRDPARRAGLRAPPTSRLGVHLGGPRRAP